MIFHLSRQLCFYFQKSSNRERSRAHERVRKRKYRMQNIEYRSKCNLYFILHSIFLILHFCLALTCSSPRFLSQKSSTQIVHLLLGEEELTTNSQTTVLKANSDLRQSSSSAFISVQKRKA